MIDPMSETTPDSPPALEVLIQYFNQSIDTSSIGDKRILVYVTFSQKHVTNKSVLHKSNGLRKD